MEETLRILHLEDNPIDAEFVHRELKKKNLPCTVTLVENRKTYEQTLKERDFDIILSDFSLPQYNGALALEYAKSVVPHIPFVFVTGEMGEERAIESLKQGAVDYVMKDHLSKLIPAVERALEEAKEVRRRKEMEERLQKSERDIRLVTDLAPAYIARLDLEQRFTFANRPYAERHGLKPETIIGQHIRDVVGDAKYAIILPVMLEAYAGRQVIADIELPEENAGMRMMHFRYAPEIDEQGNLCGLVVTMLDITEQKRAEREVLREREHTGQILDRVDDMYYSIDSHSVIRYVNRRALEFWNKSSHEVIGKRLLDAFPQLEASPAYPPLRKVMEQRISTHYEEHSFTTREWMDISAYPTDDGGMVVYFRDIGERKRAEEALRESEERYATTLKSIGDAVISTDADGCIIFMNTAAEQVTGWKLAEAVGKPAAAIFRIVNEYTRKPAPNPLDRVFNEGIVVGLANHTLLIRKDGTEVAIDDSAAPIRNSNGEITGAVLVFRNIAEKRRTEAALRLSEARFRSLYENQIDGVLLTKPDGAILAANPEACRLFGMTEEKIIQAGRNGIVVNNADLLGAIEERERTGRFRKILTCRRYDGATFRADVSSTVFTTSDGARMTSMVVSDVTGRERLEAELESLARFPNENPNPVLRVSESGEILYANPSSRPFLELWQTALHSNIPERWRNRIVDALRQGIILIEEETHGDRMFAFRVIPVIHQRYANLYGRDITEERAAEHELRQSEERYATTLKSIGDAVICTDANGVVTFMNPVAERECGWNLPEAKGMPIGNVFRIINEFTREPALNPLERVFKEGVVVGLANHTMLIRKDGTEIAIDDSAAPIRDANRVITGAVLVFRNVEEKRRADELLRHSEEKFSKAFRGNTAAMTITRFKDGTFIDVNDRWCEITGYSKEEAIGKTSVGLNIWKSSKGRSEYTGDLERYGIIHNREFVFGKKFAEEWIGIVSSQRIVLQNEEVVISSINDVTERRRFEEELNRSSALLQTVTEGSPNPIFMKDRQSRIILANPATIALINKPPERIIGKCDMEFYDDPDVGRTIMENDRRIMESGLPETIEETITTSEGTRTFLSTKTPWRDAEGTVIGLLGVAQEITDRKQIEEALRLSEERFSIALQGSPVAVATLDRDLCYTWIYNSLAEFQPADIIGKKVGIATPEHQEHILHCLQEVVSNGGSVSLETTVKNSTGIRWYVINAEPLKDAGGAITGVTMVSMDITAQKLLEESFRSSEERYHSLFNCMTEGFALHEVIFDTEGKPCDYRYLDVNPAFEQLTGLKRGDVLGKTHNEILPGDPERIAIYGNVALHGKPASIESYASGLKRLYRIYAYRPAPQQCAVIFSDITDQKRTAEELDRSERIYRAIGESIDYGIWICDKDGKNIYASDSYLKLVGLTQEQCSEFGWGDTLHPDDAERTIAAWKECSQHGTFWDIEHRFRGVDGNWHPILARGVPIKDEHGNILYWAGMNLDISRLKNAEQNLRELNDQLEHRVQERTAELEATIRDLESFSYSVSHDLRAPLRAINGFAAIVIEEAGEKLGPEIKRYLDRIVQSGSMMAQLIDELLVFTRVNRQELTMGEVNMTVLAQTVTDEIRMHEPTDHVTEISIGKLHAVKGNEALLRQVWANLIGNALKFTRSTQPAKITVKSKLCDDGYEFTIKDNGVGFDPQYAGKLFGIFQRLHPQEEYEGTGIGLALVKRIIERHGGSVWAVGKPGKGATFHFKLPAASSKRQVASSE